MGVYMVGERDVDVINHDLGTDVIVNVTNIGTVVPMKL